MKKIFFAVLAFLIVNPVYAQNLAVLKIDSARKTFAIKNTNLKKGQTILIYSQEKQLIAMGKLLGCKSTYCYGMVSRAKKGFVLSQNMLFSSTKLATNKKVVSKESVKVEEVKTYQQKAFAGIGGPPVSYGMRLGYIRDFDTKIHYGVMAGFVDAKFSDIEISGNSFGAMVGYKLITLGDKFMVFGDLEVGMFNSSLNFVKDNNGPTVDANEYYYSFAGSLTYLFGNNYDITGRLGYAINTFDERYENNLREEYTAPFAGGMPFVELSLSYLF